MLIYSLCLLLLTVKLRVNSISKDDFRDPITLTSILGHRLVFHLNHIEVESLSTSFWYKIENHFDPITLKTNLKYRPISQTNSERYQFENGIIFAIEPTVIGDEGYYALIVQDSFDEKKTHIFHVILLLPKPNLNLRANESFTTGQRINLTCTQMFFADVTYVEKAHEFLRSIWFMIVYNNDAETYDLINYGLNSFGYTGHVLNYELDRTDNNETISYLLIEHLSQPITIINITQLYKFNVQYKASARENTYFTYSFSSQSIIKINCEQFDANPAPLYSLIWTLNGRTNFLLNYTKHGRYVIENGTWTQRGDYTCFAENYLNKGEQARTSFRLNIWFDEHRTKPIEFHRFRTSTTVEISKSPSTQKFLLLVSLMLTSLLACSTFIFTSVCFCFRCRQRQLNLF